MAYDAAGNVSDSSGEVKAYTGEDKEVPVVVKLDTVGSANMTNAVISVSVSDNCGVSKVYLQYSTDKTVWTDHTSAEAFGNASVSVDMSIDTSEMKDGTVYLRAYAKDINGNISDAADSPVYSITVDNTAPEAPTGVSCSTDNDVIEVKWDSPNKDVSSFRIYRKAGSGEYSLYKDNYKYLNFFESDIKLGTVYSYKITALDDSNNESKFSDVVTGCISEDKTKPEVLCVSPENKGKIGEDPQISISCYDNFKLANIKVQCKPENAEKWDDVYYKDFDSYAEVVNFTLDTSGFETGNYLIKVLLTDVSGNSNDDYVIKYDYKKCTLSAPELTAEDAGWSVNLNWAMDNTDEIAGYYIYRKDPSSSQYSLIASTKEISYIDTNVVAGMKYYYYIEAADVRGNIVRGKSASAFPTYDDSILPVAYFPDGMCGIEGQKMNFDGKSSSDNHEISSWKWDFGDGTISTEACPIHSYDNAGDYVVSLTVQDSAGNIDTMKNTVSIYSEKYSSLQIKVKGFDGTILSGARVYCEIGDRIINGATDSLGRYSFIAEEGNYDVYFYKEGYLPQMITVAVNNETSTLNVSLYNGELLVGDLTSRPLELGEIIDLGIDVSDPDNQFVYEFTTSLNYDEDGTTRKWTFLFNQRGEPINSVTRTFNFNSSSVSYVSAEGICDKNGKLIGTAILSVSTQISWLKEFFDVELSVYNIADKNFIIDDTYATLNLPDGLSLADTARTEKLTKKMGIIAGDESSAVSWIVRGDKSGDYYLTADFKGTLMPFDTEVEQHFKMKEPLTVHGGNALQLDIVYDVWGYTGDYWTCTFTLTNVSDRPLYNVTVSDFSGFAEFHEVTDMRLEYPDGTIVYVPWKDGKPVTDEMKQYLPVFGYDPKDSTLTLEPNEKIIGVYSVSKTEDY